MADHHGPIPKKKKYTLNQSDKTFIGMSVIILCSAISSYLPDPTSIVAITTGSATAFMGNIMLWVGNWMSKKEEK